MQIIPILPVHEIIFFPGVIAPLFITRPSSIASLMSASETDGYVFLSIRKNHKNTILKPEDMSTFGTICRVLQTVNLPEGVVKVVLEGVSRAKVRKFLPAEILKDVEVERVESVSAPDKVQAEVLRRTVYSEFETYVRLNPKLSEEMLRSVEEIKDPDVFSDFVASHSALKLTQKQIILEEIDVIERMEKLLKILMYENELLALEHSIHEKVRKELDKGQRQYYLREQLKVIQEELGDFDPANETTELRKKAEELNLPEEVKSKLEHEINRFARMAPISPEATVARSYIDWLLAMPWNISSEEHLDLSKAEKIIEEDHFGLEKPKERILEYLAVKKHAKDNMRAQVLCFVGPPGVGKTSLGRSIARTMGREFVSMSLGGLRDEAEIRGHRRTYVGALPGRIIQKIKQAGVNNPVLLMDEIDKVGSDFRGDPASALLEILDLEQNSKFTDNFLEVAFDLSKVMFITTANTIETIPRPLLDRMEVISLPGYLAEEKLGIAKKHLLPRILKEHGLTKNELHIPDSILKTIISSYTLEAGVRNLDRELSKIARKITKNIVQNVKETKEKKFTVSRKDMIEMLGAPKLHKTRIPKGYSLGTALGLAWTESGGSVLLIESVTMKGKGNITYTGNLGNIMKESVQTAFAYLRSNAAAYNLAKFQWNDMDIHIHVPEGAIPKEGPSAGVTLALSICSTLTGRLVDTSYAMTGEMTLHGDILPIGGVREKLLSAKRLGVKKLILPLDNKEDVKELDDWMLKDIEVFFVSKIDDVFDLALSKDKHK